MVSSRLSRFVDWVLAAVLFIVVLICLLPILHIASVSFSTNTAILSRAVTIWPKGLEFQAYEAVFSDATMMRSLVFTVALTLGFTILSMLMTILTAYPLSRRNLKGRNFFLIVIVITMYFSGGMIPDYLLIKDLNLLNNVGSLILPGLVSAYNMIILKTFFQNLPETLEESARMDGASHLTILFRIILPLSTPVLATLGLFYAVGRWNVFQDALLYITKPTLYPLQLKLYQIVYNSMAVDISANEGLSGANLLPESLKAASVMFATIPIILVYPWLQRYFISGIMIGAIKG